MSSFGFVSSDMLTFSTTGTVSSYTTPSELIYFVLSQLSVIFTYMINFLSSAGIWLLNVPSSPVSSSFHFLSADASSVSLKTVSE